MRLTSTMTLISISLLLAGCEWFERLESGGQQGTDTEVNRLGSLPDELTNATKITLVASRYFTFKVEALNNGEGVPLLDRSNRRVGPDIAPSEFCLATIEGSMKVDDLVLNTAGSGSPQVRCTSSSANGSMRWLIVDNSYGLGNRNNALEPYRTIACDQGTYQTDPWLNGGHAAFGQRVFIPDATGVALPNGEIHDGYFVCGDIGSGITGNHIDVFVGAASNGTEAQKIDPFSFTGSGQSGSPEFTAYFLDD